MKKNERDPKVLLRQAERLDAVALLQLIHEVNPTGEGLRPDTVRQRYQLKAALQSMLVEKYGESLVFVWDAPGEIIGVKHRYFDMNACHVPLGELSDRARSYITFRRDTDEEVVPPTWSSAPDERRTKGGTVAGLDDASGMSSKDNETLSLEELRRRSEGALAEYDYEAAEGWLRQAFIASRGALVDARALADFYIMQMGRDDEGAALAAGLPRESREDARLAGMLALACARLGRLEEAERWWGASDSDAALEARLVATSRYLVDGDAEAAGTLIQCLRDIPSQLVHRRDELSAQLAALRRKLLQPREAEMAAFWVEGNWQRAGELAAAILAELPNHPAARGMLHQVAERRRQADAAQLYAALSGARSAGDIAREMILLKELKRLTPDNAEIERALGDAQARILAQETAAALQMVGDKLATSGRQRGLSAFLALRPELQEAVAAKLNEPALSLALTAIRDGVPPDAAVLAEAICTLCDIIAPEAAGADPADALDRLTRYENVLEKSITYRQNKKRLNEALQQKNRERAQNRLFELAAAVDAGAVATAAELERAIEPQHLDPARRERFKALGRLLQYQQHNLAGEQRITELVRGGECHAAARHAAELAELVTVPDETSRRTVWLALREDCLHAGDRHFQAIREGGAPGEALTREGIYLTGTDLAYAHHPSGGETVLTGAFGRSLFASLTATANGASRTLLVQLPRPLPFPHAVHLGDTIRIDSASPGRVTIRRHDLMVEDWLSFAEFVPDDSIVEDGFSSNDGRFFWIDYVEKDGHRSDHKLIVVDTKKWAVVRRLDYSGALNVVREPQFRALCFNDAKCRLRAHDERGAVVEDLQWPEENNWISFALALPEEGGWLALPDAEFGDRADPIPIEAPDDDEYRPTPLTIVFISCHERPRTLARIADATLDDVHAFVIDRNERFLFLLLRTGEERTMQLAAYGLTGLVVTELYRTAVPDGAALIHSLTGAPVLISWISGGELKTTPLGHSAPPFVASDFESYERTPPLLDDSMTWRCPSIGTLVDATRPTEKGRYLNDIPFGADDSWAAHERNQNPDDIDLQLVVAACLCDSHDLDNEADQHIAWLRERHSNDSRVRALTAFRAASRGRWGEVSEILAGPPIDGTWLTPEIVQHLHHIHGMALYAAGEHRAAFARWQKALTVTGGCCPLDSISDYLTFHQSAIKGEGTGADAQKRVKRLYALLEADRLLIDGEPLAAWRLLEDLAPDTAQPQELARVAATILVLGSPPDGALIKAAALLAQFVAPDENPIHRPMPLPQPIANWDDERIAELRTKAQVWLDERRTQDSNQKSLR